MDCPRERRRTLSAIHGLLLKVWLDPGKRLEPAATVVHVLLSRAKIMPSPYFRACAASDKALALHAVPAWNGAKFCASSST